MEADSRPIPTIEGRRAHVTLLFCDLCDSTALGELNDPEESDAQRRAIEHAVRGIVHKHGGAVAQCYGDGTLAVFGLPVPSEDDTRRAVEAALDVHETVRGMRWQARAPQGFELRMHSGIHAGLVFVRSGDVLHGRYELTGDAVNVAARLSAAAGPNELLIGSAALGADEPLFTTEDAREIALKGKQHPVRVVRVTGRSKVETRFAARQRRGWTPLAGRGPELNCLDEILTECRTGRGRIVVVEGPPGIGKTRLLEEFCRRSDRGDVRLLRGSCDRYGDIPPLQPFLQCLRQFFGLDADTAPTAAAQRVRTVLEELSLSEHGAVFTSLLSLPAEGAPPRREQLTTLSILRALTSLTVRSCESGPVVLLLDDWQWADEISRGVLRFLARNFRRQRLCVVVSMRDDAEPHERLSPHMVLKLAPLSEGETKLMIASLRAHDLDPRVTHALHERSGGNPLFVEELCCALPADPAAGRAALERRSIPTTLHELLQSRVARLAPDTLRVLQIASVIGLEFSASVLAEICDAEVQPALAMLTAQGLLHGTGVRDGYRFKHGITRDVVYETVRLAERRSIHQRTAEVLERSNERADLVARAEALFFHHRGCDQHDKAAQFAELAGDKAAASSFLGPARMHYAAALAELDALPLHTELKQRWLRVCGKWSAQCAYAPTPADLEPVARAVRYASELGDLTAQAHNSHMLGWFHYVLGDYKRSIAYYFETSELAERTKNDKLLTHTLSTLGQAYGAAGDYRQALARLNVGLELKRSRAQEPNGPPARGGARAIHYSHGLSCRAILRADLGDFERASSDIQDAIQIVADSGHAMEPSVYLHQCIVQLRRGAWSDAAKTAAHTSRLAERVGSGYVYATAVAFEAYARGKLKPSSAALQRLQEAVDWLEAKEMRLYISLLYAALAELALATDDLDRARKCAQQALRRAEQGDPHGRISAHRSLAAVSARLGLGRKQVEHHLAAALQHAHELESPREVALTSLSGTQLQVPSSNSLPLPAIGETLRELERMGMTTYARQARELTEQPDMAFATW